jgi:hypothetical protein
MMQSATAAELIHDSKNGQRTEDKKIEETAAQQKQGTGSEGSDRTEVRWLVEVFSHTRIFRQLSSHPTTYIIPLTPTSYIYLLRLSLHRITGSTNNTLLAATMPACVPNTAAALFLAIQPGWK